VPVAEQYCVGLHAPQLPPQPLSPQTFAPHLGTQGQIPQSCGQLVQVSPFCGSQLRLPQLGCGQQSLLQFWQVSPASQLPLPHWIGHTPQSSGQLLQDSLASHLALPQTLGQMPQSAGQVEQVSPLAGAHWPSPQLIGIMEHVPLALQALFGGQTPQLPPQLSPPQNLPLHCGTHAGPQPPQLLA